MATPHVVALPRLRLACRALPESTSDPDLVLAEAAALLVWARERGRVSAPWLVVDGDAVEVAAPVPADAPLADGLTERTVEAGRWAALDVEDASPGAVKAGASTLRARPPDALADTPEPVYARVTEAGATVHLRIREPG